jgi:predicted Zn-ribbon and HTH transcriptional regulator
MPPEKPSKNEDEYFAREDAARLKRLREQQDAERTAAERHSHHMRCPKCGATLRAEAWHDIQVDRCPECHGVWLDHGELETLMAHEDPGMLRRVMSDLWGSLKKERPRR